MARSAALHFSRLLRSPAAAPNTAAAAAKAEGAGFAGEATGHSGTAAGYVRTPDEQATIYFREHSGAVFRYLAGVFGREEDAEEVTQEAFLMLHQALAAEVAIESPRAWTLTVARRLMLDRIRREHAASIRTLRGRLGA